MGKSRIEWEKETVELMIRLYCHKKEGNEELCLECTELLKYALDRLEHCPFRDNKTSCQHCSVHCYRPEMREKMKQVMRYTGPRMLVWCPGAAFRHLFRR